MGAAISCVAFPIKTLFGLDNASFSRNDSVHLPVSESATKDRQLSSESNLPKPITSTQSTAELPISSRNQPELENQFEPVITGSSSRSQTITVPESSELRTNSQPSTEHLETELANTVTNASGESITNGLKVTVSDPTIPAPSSTGRASSSSPKLEVDIATVPQEAVTSGTVEPTTVAPDATFSTPDRPSVRPLFDPSSFLSSPVTPAESNRLYYYTRTGELYHLDEECEWLRLAHAVFSCSKGELSKKLVACPKCADGPRAEAPAIAPYYITRTGKKYHVDAKCDGLRYARKIIPCEKKPVHLPPCDICAYSGGYQAYY